MSEAVERSYIQLSFSDKEKIISDEKYFLSKYKPSQFFTRVL